MIKDEVSEIIQNITYESMLLGLIQFPRQQKQLRQELS